jgi:hypothetical protein
MTEIFFECSAGENELCGVIISSTPRQERLLRWQGVFRRRSTLPLVGTDEHSLISRSEHGALFGCSLELVC